MDAPLVCTKKRNTLNFNLENLTTLIQGMMTPSSFSGRSEVSVRRERRSPQMVAGLTLSLVLLAFSFGSTDVYAQDHADDAAADHEEADFDPVHHVSDDNKWDFQPFGYAPLPRIFIVKKADGSIAPRFFLSTEKAVASGEFEMVPEHADGEAVHETELLDHDDDAAAADSDEHAAEAAGDDHAVAADAHAPMVIAATHGDHIMIDLSITRHMLIAWIVMLLLYLVTVGAAKKYKAGIGRESAPRGKTMNLLETFIIFVRDDIAKPNIGAKANKFLPYLLTVFFFILGCNLIGLLPFSTTATSNITVTAILAILTFLITQLNGTKDHWMHLAGPPGVPWYVRPLLVPVEILGLFTKPFALAIRLFANMTAGHIVILSLIGLIFTFTKAYGTAVGAGSSIIWVAFTLFILCLELLVAFLQAYIFTMLSALFIGMAVEEHDHGHEHDEAHA